MHCARIQNSPSNTQDLASQDHVRKSPACTYCWYSSSWCLTDFPYTCTSSSSWYHDHTKQSYAKRCRWVPKYLLTTFDDYQTSTFWTFPTLALYMYDKLSTKPTNEANCLETMNLFTTIESTSTPTKDQLWRWQLIYCRLSLVTKSKEKHSHNRSFASCHRPQCSNNW